MTLLGSIKSRKNKNKNGETFPRLETTEVVLVRCDVVNSNYEQKSKALYTFVSHKPFGQLLDISPKNFVFLKTFNSEF